MGEYLILQRYFPPQMSTFRRSNFTFLRFCKFRVVKSVGFGVSTDLVMRGHVIEDAGGLDARCVISPSVTLDRRDPRLVERDPSFDLK